MKLEIRSRVRSKRKRNCALPIVASLSEYPSCRAEMRQIGISTLIRFRYSASVTRIPEFFATETVQRRKNSRRAASPILVVFPSWKNPPPLSRKLLLSRACSDRPENKRAGGHANTNGALHIHGIKRERRTTRSVKRPLKTKLWEASHIRRPVAVSDSKNGRIGPEQGVSLRRHVPRRGGAHVLEPGSRLASEYRRECDRGCLNFNNISSRNPSPSFPITNRRLERVSSFERKMRNGNFSGTNQRMPCYPVLFRTLCSSSTFKEISKRRASRRKVRVIANEPPAQRSSIIEWN